MNGCCFGVACDLPWAVTFPDGHPTGGVAVHPSQLYEAAVNLALYGALAWQYRRRRFPGQTFAIYLISYGVLRAALEFLRGDYVVHHLGWMTVGQMVSAGVLAAGVVLWVMLQRMAGRKANAEESPAQASRKDKSRKRSS
jgi:phosphatidylglycerol:prolipoprotein diacylglycerol transferase